MTQELDTRLQHVIRYAYENAPAVKAILDGAGLSAADIQTPADLDRVPVTGKDRLIQLQQADPPFGGFLAVPSDRLQRVCVTPGPLYLPWAGDAALTSSIRNAVSVGGLRAGDVVLNALTYHFNTLTLVLDEVLREAGITVLPAGVGNADLQLKMMRELGATAYVGTPSWLMALIQRAEESGHDFNRDFALRRAVVSAEPLPPSLRELLVEQYGLRVANIYAGVDVGVLAYDTQGSHAMRLFDAPIVQVVDPETGKSVGPGEVGEVVVTTFDETYPLIRLGTGDMAMNVDPAPGETQQNERSIILVGRVGDAVKVRGMFVHPNQLRFAASQVPGIARVQGVVGRPQHRDELLLRVVRTGEADDDALRKALVAAVRGLCRVQVDRFEFIAADALGEDSEILLDDRTWH